MESVVRMSANTPRPKKESGLVKIAICGGTTGQSRQRRQDDEETRVGKDKGV